MNEETNANKDAFDALPGRTVYVRTDDLSLFRVGNVEGEDATTLFLTFEAPDGGPRPLPDATPRALVLTAEDIENAPDAVTTFVAGRRLVRVKSRSLVEVLECHDTLQGPTRTIRARRLALDDNRWQPVAGVEDYENSDIFNAGFLAFVQKWRWLQPVDPFFDVIADEIGGTGEITSAAELHIANVRVPLQAHLTLSDTSAHLASATHPMLAMLLNDLAPRLLVRAQVRSVDVLPSWTARLVSIRGSSSGWAFDTGHRPGIVSLESPWIDIALATGRTKFTREVYDGVAFEAGTDFILRREPPLPLHPLLRAEPRGIRTTLFGRPTLIYRPPHRGDGERRLTAVLYHGAAFRVMERRALSSLIGYLAGGRAAHVLTESFDVRRKTRIQFIDRGPATNRMSPPVPLAHPTPHAELITRYLPVLAQRLAAIYRNGNSTTLDAVLHHYAEGVDSAYPMTRILRMSVAFEALVNLVTGDGDPNEAIATKATFRRVTQALKSALNVLTAEPSAELTQEQTRRFAAKIANLNLGSNTKRIKRFWRLTGVHHTETDDRLIRRLRNESVHQGFVGDESTSRSMLKNYRDANRLVDIFNRCFLAYLGYNGPVQTADGQRWVQAKNGRQFELPTLPSGPELQIDMTSSPTPPLSLSEAGAFEELSRLPRRTADARRNLVE